MLALYPISETAARFARGLAHLARKAGKPQLYHETVTIAFLAVIAERRATTPHTCWDEFISTNPDLLDKDVLLRWYSQEQLHSDVARKTFCLPAPRR